MEITWHGNSCFVFKEKGATVVINPDKEAGELKGDLVLSSLENTSAEVKGEPKIFDWPGEYECRGIPIIGFQAWTKSRSKEEEEGQGEQTIIFYFEINDIKICHLGSLGHILTSEMVNKIGDVDILMVAVGKDSNLNDKKALEVIEAIDPRVVIPMGDENPGASLKEIGSEPVEAENSFEIKSASELPDDKRKYVVLNRQ